MKKKIVSPNKKSLFISVLPLAWMFSLALFPTMIHAAERQLLFGHVPAVARTLTPIGRLPATQQLRLAIGLPLRDREGLMNLLEQLYEPKSTNFHQYLTSDQFAHRFGPSQSDYDALASFAQSNGFQVVSTHPNRMLLDVVGSVGAIERTLHLTLRVYQHPKEARTFYAPDVEPSLDTEIPVQDISGLDNYNPPHPASLHAVPANQPANVTPNNGSAPGGGYMGKDFRAAYAPGVGLTGAGQSVGLLQFDGYYASDITAYESLAGLPNVPLQNVLLDGFNGTPGANNSEVALDIEMSISMAPGLSKVLVYEAGPTGLPNDILNRMATDNLAKQLSSSWTWSPASSTTEQIFQQFAAQGQSYFNASGDSDAYTGTIDTPSDDPYITSVGGTTLTTTSSGGPWASEKVWNWGNGTGTGGGISTAYSIPSWQHNVSMSLNQGSTTMRNIPDVAMVGDNIYVRYNNGSSGNFGGTSCSTPLWAGFTALINQQSLANGRGPVGFLNPAVYSLGQASGYGSAFHDVIVGNNTSTTSPSQFYSAAGFDLCTGWGSPTGQGLINALAGAAAPSIVSNSFALVAETCVNGAVDPGETVTANIGLKNTGGAATTNLVATLLAANGVTLPSPPQTYGILSAGGAEVTLPFSFTASGSCGGTVTATLQLQDGAANLGSLNLAVPLGRTVSVTNLAENFDELTIPILPSGWSTTPVTGAQNDWVSDSSTFYSAPTAAFITDSANPGANALVSPPTSVGSSSSRLTFWHNYNFEAHTKRGTTTYFDGGVLEIQIGAGAFTDILAAGGSFVGGGYNGSISTTSDNPLAGRQAWVGSAGTWVNTIVTLPTAAAGQSVRFRWVCATDTANNYGGAGWYVDSIALGDSSTVCCTTSSSGPAISAQPASQVAPAGSTVQFSVTATGTPVPSYQWLFNSSLLPGSTASTLVLSNVQPAQAGSYAVTVSNVVGSVTSAVAELKVLVPPVIASSPAPSKGAGFQVSLASVAGLSYTLEYKNSLTDSVWTVLGPPVLGTGSPLLLQDTNAMAASRFYRVNCQ